jgi:Protein of unknown function (DUF1501)
MFRSPLISPAFSRRDFLNRAAMGIGGLAGLALHAGAEGSGLAHFPAKAKRVIWLYMDGGMSHLDTFDPKPTLATMAGKPFPMKIEATQFDNNGPVLPSPWTFNRYGHSGLSVSTLFPHIATCADELCLVRSMTNPSPVHAVGNFWMHTGWGVAGRPSAGAWVSYALGTANANLPTFVVLNGGMIPVGGVECFKSGFLPAPHSGTFIEKSDPAFDNVTPGLAAAQSRLLRHVQRADHAFSAGRGHPAAVDGAIANYELAARLQSAVPELLDLGGESESTRRAYGLDAPFPFTRDYARQCLLARRLAERGVRFIALTMPKTRGQDRWDAHSRLKSNHGENALTIDQPIAALLKDLRQRGMLDDTLVVCATEFGRTPFTQGSDGRDHNPFGFSLWMAGGGTRPGTTYGATDEYGYRATENPLTVHDFHATLLHLLGLDHERLTYHHGGRDYRLTDVHGQVVSGLLG